MINANGVNYGVNDDTNDIEVPDTIDKVPDKIETVPDTMKKCRIVNRNVRFWR